MTRERSERERALRRITEIRARIVALEFVCSGTLLHRTKRCGKPSCRCAQDPAGRHGPYYEWSRREGGRLVHTVLPVEQAALIEGAIENYREILDLLRAWERETARAIRASNGRKR